MTNTENNKHRAPLQKSHPGTESDILTEGFRLLEATKGKEPGYAVEFDLYDSWLHEHGATLLNMVRDLRQALQWYVDNDETNDISENEYWLEGRQQALKALGAFSVENAASPVKNAVR